MLYNYIATTTTKPFLAPLLSSPLLCDIDMGNTGSGPTVRVVDADGRLHEYSRHRSVAAAELMAGSPGHFVSDSSRLRVGCRIPGLAGDEELKPSRLYFLLPMDLLYSVLTEEEMASFARRRSSATTSSKSNNYISRKIVPVLLSEFCLIPPSEPKKVVVEEEEENASRADAADDIDYEVSCLRSWRPSLDTIEEAPCMME